MLMWHIVLLPLAAVVLTVFHVLLVRIKGVVHPLKRTARRWHNEVQGLPSRRDAPEWKGGYSPYDIIKKASSRS